MVAYIWLYPLAAWASVFGAAAENAPMPDPQQLKQRALASMKISEKDLEKYSCLVREQFNELNADGSLKRIHSKEEEQFFVNGVEINHALVRDGKELTGEAARKEQKRVDEEVRKYSDTRQARKFQLEAEKQVDMFLRAVKFLDGRREQRAGRSIIVYGLAPDPSFRPKNIEERFAQALTGLISLDEESGNVAELRVKTDRDVKIGGGLLANVHKGFRLYLAQERQPDGVWLTSSVEGTGDARAGLLFHPRFQFKRRLDKCHLFSVDSRQTLRETDASPREPVKQ